MTMETKEGEGPENNHGHAKGGAHKKARRGKPALLIVCVLALAAVAGIFLLAPPGGDAETPATATPSEAPATAEPTPVPTPTPTPFVISEAWFDDAVFVGDSLTSSLYNYTLVNGGLGDAIVTYANGYACHLSDSRDSLLAYMGRGLTVEDMVAETGARKVFLLLAMNDIGMPVDELRACWDAMLGRILEKNPEVRIFIQSGTPIYDEAAYFTNANMQEYNEMLWALCEEGGYTYVDIARGLADETGRLKAEYHLDFVHFDAEACAVWIENLYDSASYSPAPTE